MSMLLELELENGSKVLAEIDEDSDGTRRVSRGHSMVVEASQKLQDALTQLRPMIKSLENLRADVGPSEFEVEFGFKLSGEFGAIIAKSQAEGHFRVSLKWAN